MFLNQMKNFFKFEKKMEMLLILSYKDMKEAGNLH